MVIGEEWHLI